MNKAVMATALIMPTRKPKRVELMMPAIDS